MTIHSHILSTFLQTDLYRLEAALEEQRWDDPIATRLTDHLHRLSQIIALVLNRPARSLPPLDSVQSGVDVLHSLTEELFTAVEDLSDTTLRATVLDPYERQLPLLAHLYDYARLSAMLVEWSQHLPATRTLEDWFDGSEP